MNKAFDKNQEVEKIKVTSAEIVVHGTSEKPYYEIKYYDISDGNYHVGYSSYDLSIVFGYLKDCFEIVQEVEEESNNGWIPCSERLPKVPKGIDDAECPEFNVTINGAEESTTLKYSLDGTWFDDFGNLYDVIAWQPLPEQYQPK